MRLSESVYSLLLFPNAALDGSQRVSVLSSATSSIHQYNDGRYRVSSVLSSTLASTSAGSFSQVDSNSENMDKDKATTTPSTDDILFETVLSRAAIIDNISYESVAAVIRQCHANKTNRSIFFATYVNLMLNQNRPRFNKWNKKSMWTKGHLSPEPLNDLKFKSKCRKCGKYGH